jgi:urea carboxylase
LSPGDTVRFEPVAESAAQAAEVAQDRLVETLDVLAPPVSSDAPPVSPVLQTIAAQGVRPEVTYWRQATGICWSNMARSCSISNCG